MKYNFRKQEITSKLKILNEENTKFQKEIDDLKAKLEDLQVDIEIKNEEYDVLKLELEELRKEGIKTNVANLDPESASLKVIELEQQIRTLTEALIKVSEDRNTESAYFEKKINELKEKTKDLEELPKRDEAIRQLSSQIEEYQITVEELKEQLSIFSSASTMMDELITQKTLLEEELYRERQEKEAIRSEMETTDLLIQEYEDSNKISQDIIREKEDSILQINNTLNIYKQNIENSEAKEKQLLTVINDLKSQNKIIREELSKSNNINVDDLINKNVNYLLKVRTLSALD